MTVTKCADLAALESASGLGSDLKPALLRCTAREGRGADRGMRPWVTSEQSLLAEMLHIKVV